MARFTSVEQLKSRIGSLAQADDLVLEEYLQSAENQVERMTGRRFTPDPPLEEGASEGDPPTDTADPVGRWFDSGGRRQIDWEERAREVEIDECREIVSISVAGVDITVGGAESYPLDGYLLEHPEVDLGPDTPSTVLCLPSRFVPLSGYRGGRDVYIVGRWGWKEAPADIRDLVFLMAARAYRERDASFADMVETGDGVALYFRDLPKRAYRIYELYKLIPGGM